MIAVCACGQHLADDGDDDEPVGTPRKSGCPSCGEPHREWEHEWVFTFAAQHRHPTTGEPLQWCYVAVAGSAESAREQMVRLFATGWARQYPSCEHAGVDRYGLTEIPWPAGDRGGTS